jgi:DNA replication and repair protein RecF
LRIVKIKVSGVRNLAEQDIAFGGGLNLLTGSNGQGKSSVLEAVYLLGTTRSFRTSRLTEVVTIGGRSARISGEGEAPGQSLAVFIEGKQRAYLRHGKPVAPAEYIGTLDVIALSSEIVQRFRRQPAERRRFLDRMAVATYPSYLDDLRGFRRAAAHRALLAAAGRGGGERAAWDERTAALAVPVARRRREMAEALEAHLREASKRIFPEGGDVTVKLVSRPEFDPANEDGYRETLTAAFAAQPAGTGRRETPAGPSRDDLRLHSGGQDLLRYGSSGQVRSLLTAAALAEMNRLRSLKGRFPVLVLDDVDSDLDDERYGALLAALGSGAQVFAATSKARLALEAARSDEDGNRRFAVKGGLVTAA